jgi:hypothetical protein
MNIEFLFGTVAADVDMGESLAGMIFTLKGTLVTLGRGRKWLRIVTNSKFP